jgi:hypothetical protein
MGFEAKHGISKEQWSFNYKKKVVLGYMLGLLHFQTFGCGYTPRTLSQIS